MLNRENILAEIGDHLADNSVHSGPTAAAKLVAKFGINELAAAGIVDHYKWDRAMRLAAVGGPIPVAPVATAELPTEQQLRAKLAELKAADDNRLRAQLEGLKAEPQSPWEQQERLQDDLLDTCNHEARHAAVALDAGADVLEVRIRDDASGFVRLANVPPTAEFAITVAGCSNTLAGLSTSGCASDRADIEAEIDRRFPETTGRQRELLRAQILEDAERAAEQVCTERWEFVRALTNYLETERYISGKDCRALWDSFYGNE